MGRIWGGASEQMGGIRRSLDISLKEPPLLALGQAPLVLTNPSPPAPSTASHDDEIVSLAARDAETRAEMQKEQERRRSDDSICSDVCLALPALLANWMPRVDSFPDV